MLHKRRSLLLGDIASPGVQYASDDDEMWHDLYCHQSKATNLTMKALEKSFRLLCSGVSV